MTTNQIRFDDGAAYERYMGIGASLQVKFSSTGLLQIQVCGGSTLVAATAPLPKCSSNGVHQSQYRG